jgi:hypothetical protein
MMQAGPQTPTPTSLDTAAAVLLRDIHPIPVPYREKKPVTKGWQHLRLTAADLSSYFNGRAQNVGGLLGIPGPAGVIHVDIDIDDDDVRPLAPVFLPPTEAVYGRERRRTTHLLYAITGEVPVATKFIDPTKRTGDERAVLVEYRSITQEGTPVQSLLPGSTHPDGDRYVWDQDGAAAVVDGRALYSRVGKLAAATLLGHHWPGQGSRHDAALALAGGLARGGWSEDDAAEFVRCVAETANDPEVRDRESAARDTVGRVRSGSNATGWRRLSDLMEERVVRRAREWLGMQRGEEPAEGAQQREVNSVSSVSSPRVFPGAVAVPPFDPAALPLVARRVVVDGAAALDCPPDLIAVPLLAVAGGVIGNRLRVELKTGYQQRAILWGCTIAHPGTAKSPALAIIQSCLDTLQKEAHARRADEKAKYQAALDRWQGEDKATRGPRPELPKDEEHFYSTDSTAEGIARMLGGECAATPGFTIFREELAGWVQSFDAYRAAKGGDRQTFLSLWAGMAFKSDRAGRDSIYVPEPVVCVCGGIQPDVLGVLAPESGERDGFIERILFAYPDTRPMRWTDATIDQAALDALTDCFRKLRRAAAGVVRLAEPAALWYARWVNENAALQEHAKGLLRGYAAKLPNQVARLALVLHCLDNADDPAACLLDARTMEAAIALGEYFRAHAHRTFIHFGESALVEHPLSVRVVRALDGDWVPGTELHRRLGGHAKAEDLRAAVGELLEVGLIVRREVAPDSQGGRPRVEFRRKNPYSEETEETELTPDESDEEAVWTA